MSAIPLTGDLTAFKTQVEAHLELLEQLFGSDDPPEQGSVEQATIATRALRGSASLIGLDAFQGFLGQLFQLLQDVKASEVPWSSRLQMVLRAAAQSESAYLNTIARGDLHPGADELIQAEEHLASWRRNEAKRFEEPVTVDDSQQDVSQSAASGDLESSLHRLLEQVREVRTAIPSQSVPRKLDNDLSGLFEELSAVLKEIRVRSEEASRLPGHFEEGLRNHCEGGLRQLVEAAAREVLDEASEHAVRLGIRATGSLDSIDDELGGALLEILRNLWSDSLSIQAARSEAYIDTVFRVDPEKLLVEIRDPGVVREQPSTREEDTLGRHSGLRRSRRLVEALQGVVQVEPPWVPGCRFRLTLPYSMGTTTAIVLRVGVHPIAIPASAVIRVQAFESVSIKQDQAGTFVEIEGTRYPILHLAFALSDVSYDELVRRHVVVVGSFERRAALFASEMQQGIRGERRPGPSGPWVGTLVAEQGTWPLLDVGALLGRRAQQPQTHRKVSGQDPEHATTRNILVVNSSEIERETLSGLLTEAGHQTLAVQTAREAMEALDQQSVDLVICDLRLPDMNAQQIAERLARTGRSEDVPILLLLSHAGEQAHLVVQQLGAADAVRSPVQPEDLKAAVRRLTDGS